ncbi:hypothetical protein THMIRHAS_15990 [Thiosulfatimonas sediminis]|uniref:Uncharacterized protein n=2 Tax=Thiosulfatimonas sediminis TaxID=2675054 RepID=A0A6F8PVV1_9GAMM|nr:hypothetical protein THMIRHAS_15990 [Thiosulfatimonas sediminis]
MTAVVRAPKLLVIGAGMAATRLLDELLALGDTYHITVLNREAQGGYNRIMLSPVLAGEKSLEQIITHSPAWFAEQGIQLHTDKTVVAIDRQKQCVVVSDGTVFEYDKLVIATGAKPLVLSIENTNLAGVVSFRDIADVQKIQKAAEGGKNAVIIGGGLLGLEAAYGLQKYAMQVAVVHRSDILMNAQLDQPAATLLQAQLSADGTERSGMQFYMGNEVVEIIANQAGTHISAVRLKDGRHIACDLLVMAIGIRPHTELAVQADLTVNRGIVVDDQLLTNDAHIYALGECVEHRGQTYGLVAPLYEQAKVLAQVLNGHDDVAYQGSLTATKLKVTGVELFSAGDFNGSEASQTLVFQDLHAGVYRKLVLEESKIVGALLYGDTYDANWFFELLQQATDVSAIRETLLFGQGFNSVA